MNITMAMLWDVLTHRFPTLETALHGDQTIRGIKLLTQSSTDILDQLFLTQVNQGILLQCGGQEDVLNMDMPLGELFNALLDSYNRLRDWDMGTHLALIEGGTLQSLLDLSQPVLGNPVTVTDPSFKLLAHSAGQGAAASPVFQELCKRGYLPADSVSFYHRHGHLSQLSHTDSEAAMLAEPGYIVIIRPLLVNGQLTGYLAMPCVRTLYSEGVADCFRYLAQGVERLMAQELQSSAFSRYMYEYFLIELIEGKPMAPAAIEERLRYINLPGEGRFRLLWMAAQEEDPVLSSYLARQVADRLPNDRALPYRGGVLALTAEERLDRALDALAPLLEEQRAQCGVSRPFHFLTDIRFAYQGAGAALRLGRLIEKNRTLEHLGVEGLSYGGLVFHYHSYAAHHMAEGIAQSGLLSPLLRRIIDIDRREGSDHLRLLYGYLLCERRPTQTAAYLHMHRNNVIYRVNRLEELLGISFDDAVLRRELEFSLLALELTEISKIEQNAQ